MAHQSRIYYWSGNLHWSVWHPSAHPHHTVFVLLEGRPFLHTHDLGRTICEINFQFHRWRGLGGWLTSKERALRVLFHVYFGGKLLLIVRLHISPRFIVLRFLIFSAETARVIRLSCHILFCEIGLNLNFDNLWSELITNSLQIAASAWIYRLVVEIIFFVLGIVLGGHFFPHIRFRSQPLQGFLSDFCVGVRWGNWSATFHL